jgi:hypothetical protein
MRVPEGLLFYDEDSVKNWRFELFRASVRPGSLNFTALSTLIPNSHSLNRFVTMDCYF